MRMKEIRIRTAGIEDAKELLRIYAPYVAETAISFEYEVPTLQEFEQRIAHILEYYPYLAAERDGEIIGYAYAGRFHQRAAYDWAVESSVYVRTDQKRTGVGRKLYEALELALSLQNILSVYACIACSETEDEYLTRNSIQFHSHIGYQQMAEFPKCGYKFDRWYGMVWLEKQLGAHKPYPEKVRPFGEIREQWEAELHQQEASAAACQTKEEKQRKDESKRNE